MSKFLKNKPRLGRGLSSLMSGSDLPIEREIDLDASGPPSDSAPRSEAETSAPKDGAVLQIPLQDVSPNPHQPRRRMDEKSITELAASLKVTGLIQPIVVRKVGESYQLIAGERRWRAAKLAGLTTVPALLRDVDSFTQAQMALVENIQRENLNPIDRAQAYRTLMTQLGLTQAELAGRVGEDRSTIANHLRLLDLADSVQSLVCDGQVSLGHAKILAGVTDKTEQQRLAHLITSQGLSVRNLERLLQQGGKSAPPPAQPAGSSAHVQDLEKNLSRQLGMRIQVRSAVKKGKGRLIVHYGTLDQFDELMNRLGLKAD